MDIHVQKLKIPYEPHLNIKHVSIKFILSQSMPVWRLSGISRLLVFSFLFLGLEITSLRLSGTMPRAILFDVDGTLSDSWKLGFTSTQQVLTRNGHREITEEEYHQGTKYSTPRRFAWHLTQNPEDPIGVLLGQQFDDLYVNLVSPETTALYPGIVPMLTKLRAQQGGSIKIGALSNACGAYVKAVLDVNELKAFFDIGLGADEVPFPKPKPDGLLQICRTLSVAPSDCVYVGDSASDGQAAAAAGMRSVGVSWGSHPKSSLVGSFSLLVDSVADLEATLVQFANTGDISAVSQ